MEYLAKSLFILAMSVVLALPFILEYVAYRRDIAKGICYKRFRVIIYTAVYIVVVTVVLCILGDILDWLCSLSFVQQIMSAIGINGRTSYFGRVFATILVNFAVGMIYWLLGRVVRVGMSKESLTEHAGKDGEFTFWQKAGRRIVKFFHGEVWFLVASMLKYLSVILSAFYLLSFALGLTFGVFEISWPSYDFMTTLFSAGVLYPVIVLLALWEAYFFLSGVERLEKDCPELLKGGNINLKSTRETIKVIDSALSEKYNGYFVRGFSVPAAKAESSIAPTPLVRDVIDAVERDKRNPQVEHTVYTNAAEKLLHGDKSLLINGNFFSAFSAYFLRYLSAILARGDSAVFICNSGAQIDAVYDYILKGFKQISSIYCEGATDDGFEHPIWRILKCGGDKNEKKGQSTIDDCSVLVTSLDYICSEKFEEERNDFISFVDVVVFVDMLGTLNKFNRQLAILNTKLRHLVHNNDIIAKSGEVRSDYSLRYISRQVRYICFDDSRTPGLDKVVKNMLGLDFDTADAMYYGTETIVRCYNFEGEPDKKGNYSYSQSVMTEEELGVVMNMAHLCLNKGAGNVTVFAGDVIPYNNYMESMSSNKGSSGISEDSLRVNKPLYNTGNYSVVIAVDSQNNLPAAIRRYVSMLSGSDALLVIVSRPYLLRDYYINNIDKEWGTQQILKIPVEGTTDRDVAQRILVKAGDGGIYCSEIFNFAQFAERLKESAKAKDLNAVLRGVLEIYGMTKEESANLFNYFEYAISQDFDEDGIFNPEIKVVLRRRERLLGAINCRNMVTLVTVNGEITLPMPLSRLTQNYIEGQNLVYDGKIYHINSIDVPASRLNASLAFSGKNDEAYEYVQAREYRVLLGDNTLRYIKPTEHVVLKRHTKFMRDDDEVTISVNDAYVSVMSVPMEVLTHGYYKIDPHSAARNLKSVSYISIDDKGNDKLGLQCYRRYGNIASAFYSDESIIKAGGSKFNAEGARVMALRLCGTFGPDVKKTMLLAAAMLNELLHAMFPSVADAFVVCPVISEEIKYEDAGAALQKQPRLTLTDQIGMFGKDDFNLLIIEDCSTDLGVISALTTSGSDVFETLFNPVYEYLKWYFSAKVKSKYLYYGLDREPDCFDFQALNALSELLGYDNHDIHIEYSNDVTDYVVCDFCGRNFVRGDDVFEMDDGRKICKDCAGNLVGNDEKTLKMHVERAKMFLESSYGIELGDEYEVCFESAAKIANTLRSNKNLFKRGEDVRLVSYVDEQFKIHAENKIPSVNLCELLVRELSHSWILRNVPKVSEEYAEGLIAFVSVQYLKFLGYVAQAKRRQTYFESTDNLSGEGYRALVRVLLNEPKFRSNPFKYLLNPEGEILHGGIVCTIPKIGKDGDLGKSFTPEYPDRALDGKITYFYREKLRGDDNRLLELYDDMVEKVLSHEAGMSANGLSFAELQRVFESIKLDHPELFWFNSVSVTGDTIKFIYGAGKEETDDLQRDIDMATHKYLEGIDDNMSAYDVALRIHSRIIDSVDYDKLALNEENANGRVDINEIDYMRTICGVFKNNAAVCAGYARAMQYLLQKCGIECAEVVGDVRKDENDEGGPHAWNIVKIDGEYYYVDTTWDDPSNNLEPGKGTAKGFAYFCVTTDEISRTRSIDGPVEMPECSATKANFYVHNNLLLSSYDLSKIKKFARDAAKAGRKFVTFKCANKSLYERAMNNLFKNCNTKGESDDCFEVIKEVAKVDDKINPSSLTYNYDENLWVINLIFKYEE